MPQCSICHTKESAELVNQLLFAGKLKLQEIADQFGFSKSAVFRHSKNTNEQNCPYNFFAWRAARIRDRKGKSDDGRMIVEWPDGSLFVHHSQQPLTRAEIKASDSVFLVAYRPVHLSALIPDEENLDRFLAAALIEDQERSAVPLPVTNPENAS